VLFVQVIPYADPWSFDLKVEAQLFPRTGQLKRFRPEPDESSPTAPGNAIFRQPLQRSVPAAAIEYGRFMGAEVAIADAIANLAAQLAILLDHGT